VIKKVEEVGIHYVGKKLITKLILGLRQRQVGDNDYVHITPVCGISNLLDL